MKIPVPPPGSPFAVFFQDITQGFREIIAPMGPQPLYACTTAEMPPAADHKYKQLFNTTLGVPAVSDGTNWLRVDTGAAI